MVKAWKILGVLFLLAIQTGCASITSSKQKIKIATEPENTDIYFNDEYLGKSPGFFSISRGHKGTLRFELDGKTQKTQELETSYRWGDSLLSNFIWFGWAPVGWLVDFITGAAWDYDYSGRVSLTGNKFTQKFAIPAGQRKIAVAPPQTNYSLLSDEVAEFVEKELRAKYPKDTVLPFKQTQSTFTNYSYIYETKVVPKSKDDLYSELKTSFVAESEIKREENQIVVKTSLNDVFTDQTVDEFSVTIPNKSLATFRDYSSSAEFFSKAFDLIPNNISYGLKTPTVDFTFEDYFHPLYVGAIDSSSSIFSYLAGIGFKNARNPRLSQGLKPIFRFTSSVTLDYLKLKFERPNGINDLYGIGFDWYLLSAGIGPEVGLESNSGYFYLQFIPELGASFIHAQGHNQLYDKFSTSLVLEVELGYLVFISNRINLRLYANAAAGFGPAWKEVMSSLAGYNIPVDSASDTVGGLVVGYYFPESSNTVKGWFY